MRYKKLIFSIIACLVLSACQKQQKADMSVTFDQVIDTKALETFKIPPVLFKERGLVCTDDFLVSASATKDTLFRVFDLATMKYLGGFGKRGQGPGEYTLFNTSSFYSPKANVIQASGLKYIRHIGLKKEQQGFSRKLMQEYDIPEGVMAFNWAYQLNDTTFAGEVSEDKAHLVRSFTTGSRDIEALINYPDFEEKVKGTGNLLLYQNLMQGNRSRSKIAMAYYSYPLVSIFDVGSRQTKHVFIEVDAKYPIPENVQMKPDGMNITNENFYSYFNFLKITDQYIYAQMLVHGPLDRVNRSREAFYPKSLYILNLDGEAILQIVLEDWMGYFAPSVDNQYLYFWHPEVEDELYRLKIGDYLN